MFKIVLMIIGATISIGFPPALLITAPLAIAWLSAERGSASRRNRVAYDAQRRANVAEAVRYFG